MADIKDLLGELYTEDIAKALDGKALVDSTDLEDIKSKANLYKDGQDKASKEAAEYKRKLRELENAALTEEQKRQQEFDELQEKIKQLEVANRRTKIHSKVASLGIDDESVVDYLLNIPSDEGVESFLNVFNQHAEKLVNNAVKRTKSEAIDNTPKPEPSDPDKPTSLLDMTTTERMKLKSERPDLYNALINKE